jgi:hypothetical protein
MRVSTRATWSREARCTPQVGERGDQKASTLTGRVYIRLMQEAKAGEAKH